MKTARFQSASRSQMAEASNFDAAIAANLKELGFGKG